MSLPLNRLWDEAAVKKNKSFGNRTSHTFWKAFSFCLIGHRDGIFAIRKNFLVENVRVFKCQFNVHASCWTLEVLSCNYFFRRLVTATVILFHMSALFLMKTDFSHFLNWNFRFQYKHVPLHLSPRLVMSRKRNYLVGIPLRRP